MNSYCLLKFLTKKGKFSGFYKLCIVKTIPNLVICASFLFWAAPLTVLHLQLKDLPRSINTVIGQLAGSGAYVLGDLDLDRFETSHNSSPNNPVVHGFQSLLSSLSSVLALEVYKVLHYQFRNSFRLRNCYHMLYFGI